MCGITGIISDNDPDIDRAILKRMTAVLHSRGPDDEGVYLDAHVGLGHRRLAIIDLESGKQPMSTPDGRYTIVFNGEIYNFQEIREALVKEGAVFRTRSDTEVLLTLYALKGKACLDELNGMFAFAIWDRKKKELFAARDRMGKKPFYYARLRDHFIFASEIKSLLAFPELERELSKEGLYHFFTYEYVPAPYSIIKDVFKLKQGHFLTYKNGTVNTHRYFTHPPGHTCDDDERTAAKTLIEHLDRAVRYRLIADVPVGIFLSGGIDSSTIVSLVARHKPAKDINTFSINFKETSYDESLYAATVAEHFGTNHHEETLTADVMHKILPEVCAYMDEPFSDASIIPTYLLSRFTRRFVTVALGGDGADELFAGYPTFFAQRLAGIYERLPNLIQKAAHGMVSMLPTSDKDMSLDFKARQFLAGATADGILKNQVWLAAWPPDRQRELLHPQFYESVAGIDPLKLVKEEMKKCPSEHTGDRLLYFYQKFYLADDILTKTDRASMAHSLEVRAPFLDPNVVDYVTRLPYNYKLKGVTTKYLLKRAVNRMLPAMITQRKKKGFGIPISGWLKKELRPVLLDTLNEKRIKNAGLFNWDTIKRLIHEHLAGKQNHRKPLFALLMLHFWMDAYL